MKSNQSAERRPELDTVSTTGEQRRYFSNIRETLSAISVTNPPREKIAHAVRPARKLTHACTCTHVRIHALLTNGRFRLFSYIACNYCRGACSTGRHRVAVVNIAPLRVNQFPGGGRGVGPREMVRCKLTPLHSHSCGPELLDDVRNCSGMPSHASDKTNSSNNMMGFVKKTIQADENYQSTDWSMVGQWFWEHIWCSWSSRCTSGSLVALPGS